MDRRNMFRGALTLGAAALASLRAARAGESPQMKVVYHLADLDKVDSVLGNIRHHYEGMGGPDAVKIALVVHGPALRAFASGASSATLERFRHTVGAGLTPYACVNTLKSMNVALSELAPGFLLAEKGDVVRLAELQMQGFVYLRP